MFKKAALWLLDFSAQQILVAVLGSAALTAIVNLVVRLLVIPSWEVAWVVWTGTALVSYVVFIRTAHRWLPVRQPGRPTLDYDPKAKKHFSPRAAHELFDLVYAAKTTREVEAATKPHIGLWLAVDGTVADVKDDEGDDGEGGRWAAVTVDWRTLEQKQGYPVRVMTPPRPVVMHFMGADANAIRALAIGDYIKANGRIHSITGFLGGIELMPAELVEYRAAAPSAP